MVIRLYSLLRLQAGSRSLTLDLRQPTPLAEVLAQIVRLHPKLGPSLVAEGGRPAEHLVVTINGSQWRGEKGAPPLIHNSDVLDLFLAIGGG
ncbi:MAG: hypothetical protein A2Z30_05300 [Chloroflexi bacterium RBG_16_64_43]|nr:MAG: hypothetical protein A2Z30_05300 [Chloroflexi bacterium RBG_16_64_43]